MHKAEVGKLGIDVVLCDEAHQLKNTDAQITQAVAGLGTKRRLLISGGGGGAPAWLVGWLGVWVGGPVGCKEVGSE